MRGKIGSVQQKPRQAGSRQEPSRAAAAGGDDPDIPVRELISAQRALKRLARALRRAGLEDFTNEILEAITRFRAAIVDPLVRLLGDREFQTRETAMRLLKDLLDEDPTLVSALLRAREAASCAEIKDRLRRTLATHPALFQKQMEDLISEVGTGFAALQRLRLGPARSAELRRILEELRADLDEAEEDKKAAKTSGEAGARARFKRFEERERRRKARKPFIDRLIEELLK